MGLFWLMVGAYLCGSIPFGLLIVRAVAGVDLRTVGSGNIGASNAGRVVGKTWAAIVLLLDALKGGVPTALGAWLAMSLGPSQEPQAAPVLAGICAIGGHMFPPWLRFRGGKGVATALGVVIVLAPWGTLVAAGVFFAVFAARRIVSLSSLSGAVAFAAFQLWSLGPNPLAPGSRALALFSVAIPTLIFVRHAGNIARLLRGEEATYRTPAGKPPAESGDHQSPSVSAD